MKFRLLILAAAIGVLAAGIVQLRGTSLEVLPEFSPPYAEIQTEALGLSAEEVEQLITVPLEQDLLNGVEGVDVIRSESLPGLSSIVMVFEPGTDIYRGRQLIEERLTQAHALPNVSKPPTLLQPLSSANRVVMIGMNTTELTPIEQSVIARWTVRPRLMGVPGVANVSIWGLRDQQLQVQVDPQVLRDRNVTLNQVISTAGNAQVVSQLSFLEASTPGTGGFIETPQQRLQVRHLLEKLTDPAEVAKVPVEGAGNLTLGDVAQIKVDHQPLIGDAVVNGGPGLIMVVEKFPGANTADVTKGVEDALEALRPGLTGINTDASWFEPSDYLGAAADNLGLAIALSAGLLLLTLFALRFHWRAVIVGVITVPVSVIGAALVLHLLGYGLNALVIAGLAAAVAIVVDEAVAPQAAVLGRLRARSASPDAEPTWVATQQALATVRRPLIYAGIVALLAILPMAVLEGRPGAFFNPMVVAYATAVVAALIVGMTVGPALNSFAVRSLATKSWLTIRACGVARCTLPQRSARVLPEPSSSLAGCRRLRRNSSRDPAIPQYRPDAHLPRPERGGEAAGRPGRFCSGDDSAGHRNWQLAAVSAGGHRGRRDRRPGDNRRPGGQRQLQRRLGRHRRRRRLRGDVGLDQGHGRPGAGYDHRGRPVLHPGHAGRWEPADGHQYRDRQRAGRPDGPEHPGCRPHLRRGTPGPCCRSREGAAADVAPSTGSSTRASKALPPSRRSRSRSTWTRPSSWASRLVTYVAPRPHCSRAFRWAVSSRIRRSSMSSSWERLPREAAWRLCSRCSSIGQAAAISSWATLPRSGSRRRRRSFTVRLFRGTWTSSLILTVEASEQS